jgi:hypothetical protein
MTPAAEPRKLAAILFTAMPPYFTNSPAKRTLRWHD